MISKNLYINILVRVLTIVILSVIFGYLIAAGKSLRISLLCLLAIAVLTVNLIAFLNATNKKIKYFFDAVKNDESNLSFPVQEKNRTVREIYKSMNGVNQQIRKLKIENRNQEQYFSILIEHLAIGIVTFNNKGFIFIPIHQQKSYWRLIFLLILSNLNGLMKNCFMQ